MHCRRLRSSAPHRNDNINSVSCPWTFAETASNAHHRYYNTNCEPADILTGINWIKWNPQASWLRSKAYRLFSSGAIFKRTSSVRSIPSFALTVWSLEFRLNGRLFKNSLPTWQCENHAKRTNVLWEQRSTRWCVYLPLYSKEKKYLWRINKLNPAPMPTTWCYWPPDRNKKSSLLAAVDEKRDSASEECTWCELLTCTQRCEIGMRDTND